MEAAATASTVDHRVPELDGIRAIAIWMVLLMHALLGFQNPPSALGSVPGPILNLLGHGWLGVDLFFMLSGFLITGILLDTKSRPRYFRNFYLRRVLRIMPLYFSCVLVWSFLYADARRYFLLSSVFGANLSWLLGIPTPHGPGVLWSLAVEEHFYLLWPLVVLLLNRRQLFILATTIFLATPILRLVFAVLGMKPDLIYMLSWFRFDGLAAGALLAIWKKTGSLTPTAAVRASFGLLAAVVLLTVAGLPFRILGSATPAAVGFRYTQAYLFFGAFFVLVVAFAGTKWTMPLRLGFVQLSGALSYCLYLVHLSIGDAYQAVAARYNFQAMMSVGPTTTVLLRTGVMIVASFGVALLSRRYLEQPFLALKDRFARSNAAPTAPQPALDASTA